MISVSIIVKVPLMKLQLETKVKKFLFNLNIKV
jgi:hypothetical protein